MRFFCALLLIIAVLVFGLALPGYAIWHCGDIPLPGAPHAIIRDPVTCDFFVTTSDAHLVRIDEATNALTQTDLPAVGTALAFDPASGLLYVVHEAADMVSVVDIGTGGSAPVDVGDSPRGIAVDAVRGLAFVVNSGDSTIFVLGGATVVDTLKCAGRPWAVVADPTSGKGVALLEDAGLLLVFDHSSGDTSYYGTGLNPVAAEIDPERGEVYVANSGQNAITVFRIDSDSVFAVPVGAPARCLALNPETHRLFVGMTSNSVTIVDTDTYATQTVGLASAPGHLAVDGLSNRCFVSLDGTGTLVEIGPGGDTLVVTVDGTLDGMIVNPVTNKCYVCNSGARGISILEAADYTGVRVAARGGPGPVAINLETHQVYTPNWYTGGVTVIDGYTNSRSTIPTADGPNALRIDPVSDDLYVVCAWANKLTIKRSASPDTLLANIGRYAHGLGLNLNTGKAYVSNRFSRDLSVIDMQTLDTTLVRTGAYPCDVAVNMETNRIYTPNRTSWTLTVVDGALQTTDFARIGQGPTQAHVNPATNKIISVDSNKRTISVVDGVTLERVIVPVGATPRTLSINRNTNTMYVSSGLDGEITVVDGDTYRRRPVTCGQGLFGTTADSWLDKAYTVSWDLASVYVIDGNFLSVLRVPVGNEPHGVAYDPVLEKLYVSNHAGNSVEIMKLRDKIAPRTVVAVDTLPGDVAYTRTPTITGSAASLRSPRNFGIMKVLYKIDNLRGPWSEAVISGMGPNVTWQLTTPELLLGSHLVFVAAIDSSSGSISSSSVSGLVRMSDIGCYEFTCLTPPPPAPEEVAADGGPAGAYSMAWTQTCGEGGWYELEVSTDPAFVHGVTRIGPVSESKYSLSCRETSDGPLYWRVAAVDYPHGKQGDFSDVYTLALSDLADDSLNPEAIPLAMKAYPNPSSEIVTLNVLGTAAVRADCGIYDVSGRLVTVLPMYPIGEALSAVWDRADANGNRMPPGVYYARIKTGETTLRHKVILIR